MRSVVDRLCRFQNCAGNDTVLPCGFGAFHLVLAFCSTFEAGKTKTVRLYQYGHVRGMRGLGTAR